MDEKPALDRKISQLFPSRLLVATKGEPPIDSSKYDVSTTFEKATLQQDGTTAEIETLLKCFVGLEAVLQVLALRHQRALLPQVRADVELSTSKSFTDVRLARILTLSKGMIRARWSCTGDDVELLQVVDTESRAPHPNEFKSRRDAFLQATQLAGSADAIELHELPRRSSNVEQSSSQRTDRLETRGGLSSVHRSTEPARPTSKLSAQERMEQLRARIRQRKAARTTCAAKAIAEMKKQLRLNEDATLLHGVVAQLFSRNERRPESLRLCDKHHEQGNLIDATSSTSEEEVVSAATSTNFAVQAMSRLERAQARAAIEHLSSRSDSWFATENGLMNIEARFLRRLPGGSPSRVLDILRKERLEILDHIDILTGRPDSCVPSDPARRGHEHDVATRSLIESKQTNEMSVDSLRKASKMKVTLEAGRENRIAEPLCFDERPPKSIATKRHGVKQATAERCVQQFDQHFKRKADNIVTQVRIEKRSRLSGKRCGVAS